MIRKVGCILIFFLLLTCFIAFGSPNTRSPAEWEPVQTLILRWPGFLFCGSEERKVVVEIIRQADKRVKIDLIVNNDAEQENAMVILRDQGINTKNIVFIQCKGNDIWIRDYGPKFVVDPGSTELIGIDWMYEPHRAQFDDAFTPFFCDMNEWRAKQLKVLFEGGNYVTDDKGTAFMCDSVYKKNRLFLGLSPKVVKERIMDAFGLRNLIILPSILREHNQHIDVMAKLISNRTVLVGKYANGDPNGLILDQWAKIFHKYFEKVIRIELPPTYIYKDIEIFPTYLNSVIINKTILVPIYGFETDAKALEIYRQEMPRYTIVGINCKGLLESAGGGLHCITTTVPSGEQSKRELCDDYCSKSTEK